MHVIIAEPRGQLEKMIADAVSEEMPNARLSFARNLATAYTAAEHENPDVFIISDVLAVLPEFKVLSEIFRALSIGCIVFHEGQVDRIGNPEQVRISQAVYVTRHDLKRVLRTWARPGKKSGRIDQSSPGAHECTFDDGLVLLGASTGGVEESRFEAGVHAVVERDEFTGGAKMVGEVVRGRDEVGGSTM